MGDFYAQLFLSIVAVLFCSVSVAQDRTITGRVTLSNDNKPLHVVSVTVKGIMRATTTDNFGSFTIIAKQAMYFNSAIPK